MIERSLLVEAAGPNQCASAKALHKINEEYYKTLTAPLQVAYLVTGGILVAVIALAVVQKDATQLLGAVLAILTGGLSRSLWKKRKIAFEAAKDSLELVNEYCGDLPAS